MNSIQLLESLKSKFNPVTVQYNSNDLIKTEGLYLLDEESYFVLIPGYLNESDQLTVQKSISKLDFDQKKHNNRGTHYIGPAYSYGKVMHATNHKWLPEVSNLKAKIEMKYSITFNSLLINRYEKDQTIPFHRDDEPCLQYDPVIASQSFGENGKMVVRDSNGNSVEILLRPGSLLLMAGGFNRKYQHKVEKSSSANTRLNLTYRYVFHDTVPISQSPQAAEEIKTLDKKIHELTHIIQQKGKTYADAVNPVNKKIVVLKGFENQDTEMAVFKEKLNEHLDEINKLSDNSITSFEDHRSKKGPLIIELENIKTKAKLLKLFKKNETFALRDCLSQNANKLRKQAHDLKKRELIKAFWSYRGDIYYLPLNSTDFTKADWGKFNCLMKSGSAGAV